MRRLTHPLRRAAPLLGWLAAAVLAGCTAPPPVPTAAMQPMPLAERIDRTHPVRFSPTLATLSSDEAMRLQAFLDRLPLGPASDLRVIAQARDARQLTLATRRAEAVAAAIRAAGFDRARVVPPVLGRKVPAGAGRDGSGQGESVEVVATTYAVRLPNCPDWSRDPAFDARNLPLANLGCATAVNLGLMIADPADLVRGRGLGPADGEREAEAIERYRTGKVQQPEKDVMVP
jgi:pilus assembly protein CpaD